jgi:hypothetical protein
MRRRSRQLLILALLLPVLAGLALISLRGGASSASTVAPSARPAAAAFASAYVSFLNGGTAAPALPGATAAVRSLAASGGRVPVAYRGKVVLRNVQSGSVLGATSASALLVARTGSQTLDAALALRYVGSRWLVTGLVPPDFSTVFSPPPPPVRVPTAVRAAALAFAFAYADYRTGARARPPAGLPTIESQIAGQQDPLAGTPRTHAAARVLGLAMLPQGQLTPVDATLAAGGHRLTFTFILQLTRGGWQPWSFPESQP